MATEQDDKVTDFLNDIQVEMTERKAARYVRRVKHGRAAIFFVAFIYGVKLARIVDSFEDMNITTYIFGGITLLYAILFLISSHKPYQGLRIATIAYTIVVAYTTITELATFAQDQIAEIATIQRAAYASTILVRIGIFYFLIMGMKYAKLFEALYSDADRE